MSAFVMPVLSGLSGLFGNAPQTTTTDSSQTGTSTPNLSPEQLAFMQSIMKQAQQGMQGSNLQGYQAGANANINRGSEANNNILQSVLAARGLTYSPLAGAATAANEGNRIGQQTQVSNQMPLLRQQLLQQNLAGAVNAFRATPYGTTTNQTGHSTQTKSGGGVMGMLSGLFGGLGAGIEAGGGWGNILKGIGGSGGGGGYTDSSGTYVGE
jgi:hypothetical protein